MIVLGSVCGHWESTLMRSMCNCTQDHVGENHVQVQPRKWTPFSSHSQEPQRDHTPGDKDYIRTHALLCMGRIRNVRVTNHTVTVSMRWLMFGTRASEGVLPPAFVSLYPVMLMLIFFWGQLSSIGDWSPIWKCNVNLFQTATML